MKRAIGVMVLVMGCVAVFSVWGGGSADSKGTSAGTNAASAVKAGLVIEPSGLGDKSVNDQAHDGLLRAESELGVEVRLMEPRDSSQFLDMNQRLADSGYEVIVNNAFSMADAVAQVADSYPNVQFVILDTVVDKPNVLSATYETHKGSFLAGVVAAMNSKSGIIGFVGGMKIPTIERFEVGYIEGAKYINPRITVISKYVGNDANAWSDAARGKALTEDLASNGADVVYHAAGGTGLGVIDGCASRGIWAIGVNIDQEHIAPNTVLTSMLTRGDNAVYQAIEARVRGKKLGTRLVMDLNNDGVGVVLSRHLSAEVKAKVEEVKQKIIAGEIAVTDAMR
ncbi:MAG: BMP family ABC transporter substrate-binding protein [Spirochaetaceae bacterium]|nr:BMP family ABC transporter substrate-binding protein [Spirochaetaceae bacterium]